MSYAETLDRIPPHLKKYVVQQDYDAYDQIDQSVWRFVLLQTYNQLKATAHPSYVDGLAKTGISVDRIPRIEEMNDCLGAFGWGAVAVSGFIPPRAFQEFQSLGILTIAADMRKANHLAYTPAPDIIHEAAGHAPIIPDPVYRKFLQRFGEVSRYAFSSREDLAVYEAIRRLSIVKEELTSTPAEIRAVEDQLWHAIDNISFTSEAAYLSRLHWWTVEYGLIGKPEDYKIYGAGILSSVGESFMLHLPEVKKLRLRARCIETDYDITEQQPQLFVVEDFEALNEILDRVVHDFAFKVGGNLALLRAVSSGEVATVLLNTGLQVTGLVEEVVGGDSAYLRFTGPSALSYRDRHLPGHCRKRHPDGFGMPLGRMDGGTALSGLTEWGLDRIGYKGPGSKIEIRYQSGVYVEGRLQKFVTNDDGFLMLLTLSECRVVLGDRLLFDPDWGEYDLAIGEEVMSAYAGAADPSYWPESEFSEERFPKEKVYTPRDLQLLELYKTTLNRDESDQEQMLAKFGKVTHTLFETYPDHWLLGWNILERLTQMDRGIQLACKIKDFMLAIEQRRPRDIPVSMGLNYLGLI